MAESSHGYVQIHPPSPRSFAVVMAVAFGLLAVWLRADVVQTAIASYLTLKFALVAWLKPAAVSGLNHGWFVFGMALARLLNPLSMALIYGLAVIPTALLMRIAGADPLRLKPDPKLSSYWIEREPGRSVDFERQY